MKSKTEPNQKTLKVKTRKRALPKHCSFRISKKIYKHPKTLPGAVTILRQTAVVIYRNKRLFFGLMAIYLIFSFLFIRGLVSAFNISEVKLNFETLLGEQSSSWSTAIALLGYLVSGGGASPTDSSSTYQVLLSIIVSLAVIWIVRQLQAGEKPRLRDGFYKGMYPLIPFVLVIIVICVQLIPLIIGNVTYSIIIQNGLAATVIEKVLWLLLFIFLALLTLYMLTSSVFSLYIVTLADMTPLKALRSARQLVLHRRLAVGLRIIVMPLILILLNIVILVPLLILFTPLAPLLFMLLVSFCLVAAHTYMYLLYRALL
jgi:hypothetical protein